MSRFKKSYGKWAVNRKNQYDCGAGKEGNKGFQPGNTCGGNGDGKDTSADQGGGDGVSWRTNVSEFGDKIKERHPSVKNKDLQSWIEIIDEWSDDKGNIHPMELQSAVETAVDEDLDRSEAEKLLGKFTESGNGDGKDTSADQGGGDEQSEEKSGEVDEIAPTPSKSRPDQPPKNMSKDEEDLYNEPDGEFYVHLIPSAGKFIDGGEFNEREDKSIKRILDIIGRDRLSVSDKGIMFDSLSKYGAEIIRRSLRKAGLGMYADMGGGSDW